MRRQGLTIEHEKKKCLYNKGVPVITLGTLDDHGPIVVRNMRDIRSSHSGTLHMKVKECLGESDAFCGRCRVRGGALVAGSE